MRFAFVVAFVSQLSFGQNLVANGSFENYYNCPGSFNISLTSREIVPSWKSPTDGTPDIFNACSEGIVDVPYNWAGVAKAHTGKGYAGIFVMLYNRVGYREYLQTELIYPLVAGRTYQVEFYFKLSSYSRYSIDRIGALLTDSAYYSAGNKAIVKAPSISKIYDSAFRRSSGLWEKVKRNYVANGGEKFLTIGNFWNDTKIKKFHIEYEAVQEPMLARACYYYIDDVSVVDLDSTQTLELIPFIDTKAVKTNEVYVLRNIQFEFNKSVLKTDSYPELTKLVTILSKNTGWKVLLTGHTDDVGTDEYNVQLSKNRAISVGDFLIKNGIEKARIVSNGMGKSEPLANTTDENARAANRRVEVIFLEEDEKK